MKKHSEYFAATVFEKIEEKREVPEIRRSGFLLLAKTITYRSEVKHFVRCKFGGISPFFMDIPINKEDYERIKPGDTASVHLDFTFEYICLHFSDGKSDFKEKVLKVE